jgi:hypothetical protein
VKNTTKSEPKKWNIGQNPNVAETIPEANKAAARRACLVSSTDKLYNKFHINQACNEVAK